MKKTIAILGSTGSIGMQSLKILSKKKNSFEIYLLSANKNIKQIKEQILRFKPKFFLIKDINTYNKIKKNFKYKKTKIIKTLEYFKIKKKD